MQKVIEREAYFTVSKRLDELTNEFFLFSMACHSMLPRTKNVTTFNGKVPMVQSNEGGHDGCFVFSNLIISSPPVITPFENSSSEKEHELFKDFLWSCESPFIVSLFFSRCQFCPFPFYQLGDNVK